MTPAEVKHELTLRSLLLATMRGLGMRPLPDSEGALIEKMRSYGVVVSVAKEGYMVLQQTDGSPVVVAAALEKLRRENVTLFTADGRRDEVSSREQLGAGLSREDAARSKSLFIKNNGYDAWERLHSTKADAEKQSVPVSADLTRSEYLALPFKVRVELCGTLTERQLGRIMARHS